jgi:peptidoglycan/xylan/chitin deacetylase (PgdA/CDA1 family)
VFLSLTVSMLTRYPAGSVHTAERTVPVTSVEVHSVIYKFDKQVHLTLLGLFAGTIGTQRLLKLFKKYNIKSTWFIPGHSLETFPEDMRKVVDEGHEIGLHGYSHENPVDMSIEQQKDVLDKTYRMLTDFVGKPPRGSVAPW